MPTTISLDVQNINLLSDKNVPVAIWRAAAACAFLDATGSAIHTTLLVDSGTPLSIIPYSIWHDRNLRWTALGSRLTPLKGGASFALDWRGISCDLGETSVNLIDLHTGRHIGPFLIVGKFPRHRHPQAEVEIVTLLGMNFLTDKFSSLELSGSGGAVQGRLIIS